MKLLLDELYTHVIAEQLRDRGHDVVSVHERPDLEGLKEFDLFRLTAAEARAIVTENWPDFQRELQNAAAAGLTHYGVVFTSRQRLPRSKKTIGLFVRVLGDFLERNPREDALLDSYCWLPEAGF